MKHTLFTLVMLLGISFTAKAQDYDANRGFIHPGGLHTQADFDRVKQQLADGNATVKAAYQKLTSAAYAQSTVQTSPLETIVRGGGSGENYINAARGATMAYQNALRWKIDGTEANAKAAVRILMAWANVTTLVTGDSNYALAAGLYGYQFAQAAELMRDYEGWAREDFEQFKRWMLRVWYAPAISFLRGRNGTWENSSKWWQAPGHYWSNWGLCNALCVASIGVLCDDVYIYNQGMSFFKYDQVGSYANPQTMHTVEAHDFNGQAIWNDGLTEFLGNLVVTNEESDLETGAYGRLGQMNESGRDTGHSAMALGLAIDLAKLGWNQGDDLFAYMDHRLASGIEYVAAQTQNVENLPWTPYLYGSNGYYYSDYRSWLMLEPALGAQMRPYWGTVIGIYEGVKGVKMPFSERSYKDMGIDEGGMGSTSGGYDHLGYSVLMNTRDEQLCPADRVPTELSPMMEYSGTLTTNLIPSLAQERSRGLVTGKTILHSELGGLVNTYIANNKTGVPAGQTLRLVPQLPDGEEDTGQWQWNTGETTREITVSTDKSYIYRVTYTNKNGVESQLAFSIASQGDCTPDELYPSITVGTDSPIADTTARILYGKTAKLSAVPSGGWGTWKWTGNKTTQEITTSTLKETSTYSVDYTNQGGAVSSLTFNLNVLAAQPFALIGTNQVTLTEEKATAVNGKFLALHTSLAADADSELKLGLTLPSAVRAANVTWNNGEAGDMLVLSNLSESQTYTACFTLSGEEVEIPFDVLVRPTEPAAIVAGRYLLRHVPTDTYLTAHGRNQLVTFQPYDDSDDSQLWYLEQNASGKCAIISLATTDSLSLYTTTKTMNSRTFPFYIDQAVGSSRLALRTGTNASRKYWDVIPGGSVDNSASTTLSAFPFQLVPVSDETAIRQIVDASARDGKSYDLSGRQMVNGRWSNGKGIYIVNGKKVVVNP